MSQACYTDHRGNTSDCGGS